MEIETHLSITSKEPSGSRPIHATLQVRLPFVPIVGMMIAHPTWHEPRRINSVSICIDGADLQYVCVSLEARGDDDERADIFRANEWTIGA